MKNLGLPEVFKSFRLGYLQYTVRIWCLKSGATLPGGLQSVTTLHITDMKEPYLVGTGLILNSCSG